MKHCIPREPVELAVNLSLNQDRRAVAHQPKKHETRCRGNIPPPEVLKVKPGCLMGMHQGRYYAVTGHCVHGGAEYKPDASHRREGPPKGLMLTQIVCLSGASTSPPVGQRMMPFE